MDRREFLTYLSAGGAALLASPMGEMEAHAAEAEKIRPFRCKMQIGGRYSPEIEIDGKTYYIERPEKIVSYTAMLYMANYEFRRLSGGNIILKEVGDCISTSDIKTLSGDGNRGYYLEADNFDEDAKRVRRWVIGFDPIERGLEDNYDVVLIFYTRPNPEEIVTVPHGSYVELSYPDDFFKGYASLDERKIVGAVLATVPVPDSAIEAGHYILSAFSQAWEAKLKALGYQGDLPSAVNDYKEFIRALSRDNDALRLLETDDVKVVPWDPIRDSEVLEYVLLKRLEESAGPAKIPADKVRFGFNYMLTSHGKIWPLYGNVKQVIGSLEVTWLSENGTEKVLGESEASDNFKFYLDADLTDLSGNGTLIFTAKGKEIVEDVWGKDHSYSVSVFIENALKSTVIDSETTGISIQPNNELHTGVSSNEASFSHPPMQ
jgi:hypothetical protein